MKVNHQEHGRASPVDVGKDGNEDGAQEGASPREADPQNAKHVTLADLNNVGCRAILTRQMSGHQIELSDDRGVLVDSIEETVPEDDPLLLVLFLSITTLLG